MKKKVTAVAFTIIMGLHQTGGSEAKGAGSPATTSGEIGDYGVTAGAGAAIHGWLWIKKADGTYHYLFLTKKAELLVSFGATTPVAGPVSDAAATRIVTMCAAAKKKMAFDNVVPSLTSAFVGAVTSQSQVYTVN